MENRRKLFLLGIVVFILVIITGILLYFAFIKKDKIVISFNTDSQVVLKDIEIEKGNSIDLPMLQKDGYEFLGWYINDVKIDNNYKFDESITIYAKWDKEKYTISFNTDGGTSIQDMTLECGKIMLPSTPSKEGYTFIEWQDENGTKVDNNSVLPCKNTTLKAVWEKEIKEIVETDDTYTVTFMKGLCNSSEITKYESNCISPTGGIVSNDGQGGTQCGGTPPTCNDEIYMTVKIKKGNKTVKPIDPTRSGFKFLEWQLDGKKYDFNAAVTKSITLVAKWESSTTVATTKHKVYFYENSAVCSCINCECATAKASKIVEVEDGKTVTKPQNPTQAGYQFMGWQLKDGKMYDFNTAVKSDLYLYAKWEKNSVTTTKYTVTFDSNGGSSVPSQIISSGNKVVKPSNPTRSGYTFVEWQLDGKKYDFNTVITKSMTLVAKWQISSVKSKTYTVTFNSNGGSNVPSQVISSGNKAVKPSNPTRSGYTFVEWQLDGIKYDFNTAVNKAITLVAKWEKIVPTTKYTVTFYTNGLGCSGTDKKSLTDCINNKEVYLKVQVNQGEKVTKPTDPTRSGYTFVEWQLNGIKYDFNKAVNSNIELYPKWQLSTGKSN